MKVPFDGLERHEELLRDLAVRQSLRSEIGDPLFAWRQRLEAVQDLLTRPRSKCGEFDSRPFCQCRCAALARNRTRAKKWLACSGPFASVPKRRPEIDERANLLQARSDRLKCLDSLLEQCQAL